MIGLAHAGRAGLWDSAGIPPGVAERGDPDWCGGGLRGAPVLCHVRGGTGWRVGR